jgi:hypothetical protein
MHMTQDLLRRTGFNFSIRDRAIELCPAVRLDLRSSILAPRAEARDLLAPIYNWFTEGFDTPVLQDAKALLDQLT